MKTLGSIAAVLAAMQDETAVELERLKQSATDTLARAQPHEHDAQPHDPAERTRRLAIARSQARERLAREDYLDRRAELEARETWFRKVVAAGRVHLRAVERPRVTALLGALADEALSIIPARECVLLVRPDDRACLDEAWLAERLARSAKQSITIEAADIDGGCVAQSADGRVRFDNTFTARADRFESTWRHLLARQFEEACR